MNIEDQTTPLPVNAKPESESNAAPVTDDSHAKTFESGALATGPKIAIGSQRDAADKSLAPSQPKAVQAAVANPIVLGDAPTPPPAPKLPEVLSDAGLSDDIDAEIEAALGEISMDDVVSNAVASDDELESGTRLKAKVARVHQDNVFVKLAGQYEGVAVLHQFPQAPVEGDEVDVIIRGLNREDGLYELAVPGAAIGAADWENLNEGDVVEARISGSNTGGLEADVNNLQGFIPASQIDRFRVEDFGSYVGRKLPCVVVEVNPEKRRLVLSHRAVLERENEENRKKLLAELEVGQLREGLVTKLMDFGAFVDLGGAEGLIHISKLSWSRVKHPSDVLQAGQKVKVKIESIDNEANRISLSHRDTLEHPWQNVQDEFQADQIVKGTVTRIADFGAFVKLSPGIEGLVHISEVAYQRVTRIGNYLKEGQEIEVKILSIDADGQKISLSHKACLAPPKPKAGSEKPAVEEEPDRDLAIPGRQDPLKGGTDRKSGGESIGLKW